MSLLADKLKAAGADTLGAEFTTICIEALKLHPNNVVKAWDHVGNVFGQGFLLGLMKAGPGNVPNDGRNVGQVLGIKQTDEIIARVRGME